MANIDFNTAAGLTVDRHLLVAYLNTGTAELPVWSPLGKRVTDSSMELDWSSETKTDILGEVHTNASKPTVKQTFDPCELDSGDAAQELLWNLAVKDQNNAALAAMDMLIVHAYAGTAGTAMFAERYSACAVLPSSLGGPGGGSVGMPIEVTYGGTRTVGTAVVDAATGVVTFAPGA